MTMLYAQVSKLKRAAESRFDSILSSIRQGSTAASSAAPTPLGPGDLQARLEAAIGVLQDGLVERDTEVGSTVPHMQLARSADHACLLGGLEDGSVCSVPPCMPGYHVAFLGTMLQIWLACKNNLQFHDLTPVACIAGPPPAACSACR